MQQYPSATQSTNPSHTRVIAAVDDQPALVRGLVHGLILSMAMWIAAAGCLTLLLD